MAEGSTPAVPAAGFQAATRSSRPPRANAIRPTVAMTERRRDRVMVPPAVGCQRATYAFWRPCTRQNSWIPSRIRAYTARPTEATERTGSPQRNGATEVKREVRRVRRVGLRSRPTSANGSIGKTSTRRIRGVFVFTIDPHRARRFATPVEPAQLGSISVSPLLCG